MGRVKQITVALRASGGTTAALMGALGKGKIRLRACLSEAGTARLVVDDPERTLAALRDAGLEGWLGEAVSVDLPADPKVLESLVDKLEATGVEIEAAYTGTADGPGRAALILVVSDIEKSLEVIEGFES